MNKPIALLTLVCAFGTTMPAMAQSSIGLRGGVNYSNVAVRGYDGALDSKSLFGFAFGLAAELGLSKNLAFQPEVLYSQHGVAFEEIFLLQTIESNLRYNYLQVPLLAKLKFGAESVGGYFLAGPHLGFGLGDFQAETSLQGDKHKESFSWEFAGQKKSDFGLTFGLGLSFPAGPGKLELDARYQVGLSNIIEEPIDGEQNYNRNFQLGLGYLFRL